MSFWCCGRWGVMTSQSTQLSPSCAPASARPVWRSRTWRSRCCAAAAAIMGCKTGLLSRPPIKCWARLRRTLSQSVPPQRPNPSLALLCPRCVEYWFGLLRCVFYPGWRSPEVTSPGWQSAPTSTMRMLTLATCRWVPSAFATLMFCGWELFVSVFLWLEFNGPSLNSPEILLSQKTQHGSWINVPIYQASATYCFWSFMFGSSCNSFSDCSQIPWIYPTYPLS